MLRPTVLGPGPPPAVVIQAVLWENLVGEKEKEEEKEREFQLDRKSLCSVENWIDNEILVLQSIEKQKERSKEAMTE